MTKETPILVTYSRGSGVQHRSAVTAVDKLVKPTLVTTATAAVGGSLEDSTTYKVAVAPGNEYGSTDASNILDQATAADAAHTHCVTVTIPQVTGATYYDIFFSVDAAPLWVARVTEAQRAAGDYKVTAVGTVAAGGGNAAGTILICVVGTGIATTAVAFTVNNAYKFGSITAVDISDTMYINIYIKVTLTDLRALPTLKLLAFGESNETVPVKYLIDTETVLLLNGTTGTPLRFSYSISSIGIDAVYILIDTLTGQGASVDIWVEGVSG